MAYQSGVTYTKAKFSQACAICEDPINIGDDILYCPAKKDWEHVTCPWRNDKGYRPDMVIIDVDTFDNDYFKMKKDYDIIKDNKYCEISTSASWHDRIWVRIQNLFGY